jgi:hypothetical protein
MLAIRRQVDPETALGGHPGPAGGLCRIPHVAGLRIAYPAVLTFVEQPVELDLRPSGGRRVVDEERAALGQVERPAGRQLPADLARPRRAGLQVLSGGCRSEHDELAAAVPSVAPRAMSSFPVPIARQSDGTGMG